MPEVAQTAYVDPQAKLADDVVVGHSCYVGPDVTIGPGCTVHNNVTITGNSSIGTGNVFFQNAVIGTIPQDLKYHGGDTRVSIGNDNIFRENVTVHLGTELAGAVTAIGNGNLFMAGVHVAHDCQIDNQIIVANNAMLAGHVKIDRCAVIGGGAGLHHFVTVGRNAMVGGLTRVVVDVPPFMIYEGNPGSVRGVNSMNLVRNGFTPQQVEAIKDVYKKLFRSNGSMIPVLEQLNKNDGLDPNIRYLVDAMQRSLQGRHGRYRETLRQDSPEDLGKFYSDQNNNKK